MSVSPIAVFAAGFVAGGIILGGAMVHAQMTLLTSEIAGVQANSEGHMICVTRSGAQRSGVTGVFRSLTVPAPGGGQSSGVTLRCPA